MLTEPYSDNVSSGEEVQSSVSATVQPLYLWYLITSVIELLFCHKYKEQVSPLPDGGAAIHLEDKRDFHEPCRPYESNCSWGSFLLQMEMIWEPQSITQAWPGPSTATTAVTCGTPVSLPAPSPSPATRWAGARLHKALTSLLDGAQVSNREEAFIDFFKGDGREREEQYTWQDSSAEVNHKLLHASCYYKYDMRR